MTPSNTPSNKELRQFAQVVSAGAILIFGLMIPWLWGLTYPMWPWVTGAILLLWSFIHANSLVPLYRGWMLLGALMHRIMNPIILGVIFFFLFAPLGLLKRLISGDSMNRHLNPQTHSYRIKSTKPPTDQMEKPF